MANRACGGLAHAPSLDFSPLRETRLGIQPNRIGGLRIEALPLRDFLDPFRRQHVDRPLGTGLGTGGDFFQRIFAEIGSIGEAAVNLLCVRLVRVSAEESFQPAEARHGGVFPLDSEITPKAVEVGIVKPRRPQTFQDLRREAVDCRFQALRRNDCLWPTEVAERAKRFAVASR